MARLPTVGGDYGNWGTVLNGYLATAHNADGTLRADVASIAALKALIVSTIPDKMQIMVGGYYAHGDGGGGQFYYDAGASDTDNGGTIIAPTAGAGRWKRVWDGVTANALWFGVLTNSGDDQTAVFQNAIDVATSAMSILFVPAGTYRVRNLIVRSNTNLCGIGRGTILKLLDNSVNWDRPLGTEFGGSYSGIDNVIIRDLTVDGNRGQIGLSNNQMHGISIYGEHDNWLIDNVHSQNTCGDGIWVAAAVSETKTPTNIRISRHSAENTGRQNIAIVNVDGCTVSYCVGDGNFDIEANNSLETCRNITVSNLRYQNILISPLGAKAGGTEDDSVTANNLNATGAITVWGCGYGTFSNLNCAGKFTATECYRCTFTNIVASNAYIGASNSTSIRECIFAGMILSGLGNSEDYGIYIYNQVRCSIRGARINVTNASSDGIKTTAFEDKGAGNRLFLSDIVIETHTRYGIYVVNGASIDNITYVLDNVRIFSAGTNPILYTSGASTPYGEMQITNCNFKGTVGLYRPRVLRIDGLVISGDYNMYVQDGAGCSTFLHNIKFVRETAGTPLISLNGATGIAALTIGKVWQEGTGGFTVYGTIGFASGKTAWIDGPIVEVTTWADVLGTNIRAGSHYRLRNNTTNYAYTHNGTAWVAKAH